MSSIVGTATLTMMAQLRYSSDLLHRSWWQWDGAAWQVIRRVSLEYVRKTVANYQQQCP